MTILTPNQTLWIAALRSGDYRQGRNSLCDNRNYCCLGVAAELFQTPTTEVRTDPEGTVYFDTHCGVAPTYVMEALGLRGNTGPSRGNPFRSLAALNDNGCSFDEIADILEAHPGEYFL